MDDRLALVAVVIDNDDDDGDILADLMGDAVAALGTDCSDANSLAKGVIVRRYSPTQQGRVS